MSTFTVLDHNVTHDVPTLLRIEPLFCALSQLYPISYFHVPLVDWVNVLGRLRTSSFVIVATLLETVYVILDSMYPPPEVLLD